MKKYISLILIILLTTGCVRINNSSIDQIINATIEKENTTYNFGSRGYKMYVPRGLSTESVDEYNEIIRSEVADYYLYVDLVSYYNKINFEYKEKEDIYYSKIIKKQDNVIGLIDIKNVENNYVINIVIGYSKIEVKCKKENINNVVSNSLIMLNSIKYNDDVIESLLNDNGLLGEEETVSIFDKTKQDINALEYDETYTGEDEYIYDPDEIN